MFSRFYGILHGFYMIFSRLGLFYILLVTCKNLVSNKVVDAYKKLKGAYDLGIFALEQNNRRAKLSTKD